MGWPELAHAALARMGWDALPERVVVIDVERQRLALLVGGVVRLEEPVSTASAGIGGEPGSNRTPAGWHRIHARIGGGAALGAVFRGRKATGGIWSGEDRDQDLILTRILTLDGLEDGNRASLARYVYLHGTNHERKLGTAASHGCVRLSNAGVAALFDQVVEGDTVLIVVGSR